MKTSTETVEYPALEMLRTQLYETISSLISEASLLL